MEMKEVYTYIYNMKIIWCTSVKQNALEFINFLKNIFFEKKYI